ncbi:MAG TPA: pitrilysin family protein [candidate division Zixibacteria bacterium]|nr:pitrilysin family protein [candidate division Zixibacteria bacterium]
MTDTHLRKISATPCCVALTCCLIVGSALANEKGVVDTTLANGLTVLLLEDHSDPLVSVWLDYRAGARQESPGKTGLAKVALEVMKNGSLGYRRGEYSRLIHSGGGETESGAWHDGAFFAARLPVRSLRDVLLMEADRMEYPNITPEAVERAKTVVALDRKARLETDPYAPLVDELLRQMYTAHPYGRGAYGSPEDIASLRSDDVDEWLRTYYRPSNAVLTLVGDFKTKETLAMVDEIFGDIPDDKTPIPPVAPEPPQNGERRATTPGHVRIPVFIVGFHTVSSSDEDLIPLQLLAKILISEKSSLVYQRLVLESDVALSTGGGHVDFFDSGLIYGYAFLNRGNSLSDAEAALYEEIDRVKSGSFSDADLMIAKNQMQMQLLNQAAGSLPRAGNMSESRRVWGDGERWLKNIEAVQAVTVSQIQDVAQRYLRDGNRTVIYLEPGLTEERGQ